MAASICNKFDVMISYSHSNKKTVKAIKEKLKEAGLTCWIDEEHMSGNLLDSMSAAVDNSSIFLMCYSSDYFGSKACRKEAEYADNAEKIIIPCKMEEKFKAKGWLGMIIGCKLFFDFSGKYSFENKICDLIREINKLIRKENPELRDQPLSDGFNLLKIHNENRCTSLKEGSTETDASKLLVVAIDIGLTHSGYAFSFREEYKKDPQKLSTYGWSAEKSVSFKVPTCVLFGKDNVFNSFGFEAEEIYSILDAEEKQENWYFFRNFLTNLWRKMQPLSRSVKLQAENGKEMQAIHVVSAVLRCIKDVFLRNIKNCCPSLIEREVQWVITVCDICNDYNAAKKFMMDASEMAGIESEDVLIVSEAEAVVMSFKLQYLSTKSRQYEPEVEFKFSKGSKLLVLDCGGETTVAATLFEIKDSDIKELYKANGGAWGGRQVDEAFKQLLIKIVGAPVLMTLHKKYRNEYEELFRQFHVKMSQRQKQDGRTTLKIPFTLHDLFENETGETISESIQNTDLEGKLVIKGDLLRMNNELFESLFKDACTQIIIHVNSLLQKPEIKGTDIIYMVGGFSESNILQSMIRKAFPYIKIIISKDPAGEVLKGAVVYGHEYLTSSH